VATIPQISESMCPSIVEAYRDFEPPTNFKQTIETLLRYAPSRYLLGLKTIGLTNQAGLTSKRRKQRMWSRGRKVRVAECLGSYQHASNSSPQSGSMWIILSNRESIGGTGSLCFATLCHVRFCTMKSDITFILSIGQEKL